MVAYILVPTLPTMFQTVHSKCKLIRCQLKFHCSLYMPLSIWICSPNVILKSSSLLFRTSHHATIQPGKAIFGTFISETNVIRFMYVVLFGKSLSGKRRNLGSEILALNSDKTIPAIIYIKTGIKN